MSEPAAFDGAPEKGTINFSVGQPSADLLPIALLHSAAEKFFASVTPLEMNYGARQGDPRFRAALADFLGDASADSLLLTAGISQALDYACGHLSRPGDTVFIEEPTYPYSIQVFHDHGLKVVGLPLDGQGMDLAQLERLLKEYKPKLLYTIPSYHNPTGQLLDRAKRERLVALSREHGFIILADEVYQLLHHGKPPPPSLGSMADQGNVISLGTFSKILAPGLRLGWIQTNPALMQRLLATGALVSGGNFNHFASHVVRQLLEDGRLLSFVGELREKYAARADAMDAALRKHLDGVVRWQKPEGGYFFWLSLPQGLKAADYLEAARAAGTGFLAGPGCSSAAGLANCLRLSFAHYTVPDIHEGIARLGRALGR